MNLRTFMQHRIAPESKPVIRPSRYLTCIEAQLSDPVSPLQLDEAVPPALGNTAPAAQPLCGAAPLPPPIPAFTCGQSGRLLQRSRSTPTACDNPAVESLVTRAVSPVDSVSLIST